MCSKRWLANDAEPISPGKVDVGAHQLVRPSVHQLAHTLSGHCGGDMHTDDAPTRVAGAHMLVSWLIIDLDASLCIVSAPLDAFP